MSTIIVVDLTIRLIFFVSARTAAASRERDVPALHIRCDCRYLYQLNPDHPEVSSQGLRDRVYTLDERVSEEMRILVLGDSVAYGVGVSADSTFPTQIERRMRDVAVINSGVSGFTAYNEVQYYLEAGFRFEPTLVLVIFVPNDIANPRLHINYPQDGLLEIPEEAIPNKVYDREVVLPRIRAQERARFTDESLLDAIAVLSFFRSQWDRIGNENRRRATFEYDGRRWPTYVTGEDDLSIRVLLDYASPEWQWLRRVYGRLQAATSKYGVRVAIAWMPLAYELEDGYPFHPGEMYARYCAETLTPCVDLLPALRTLGKKAYLGSEFGFNDVWHLSEGGHSVVAEALRSFLASLGERPSANAKPMRGRKELR